MNKTKNNGNKRKKKYNKSQCHADLDQSVNVSLVEFNRTEKILGERS